MIDPGNIPALLAALLCLAAVAAALEVTAVGKRISGVGIVLIASIAASQFQIIPRSSPLYDAIWAYLVPLAIALFLLKADLLKVFSEGGRVLFAFAIGAAGTVAGGLAGAALLDLGPLEPSVVAVYSATYIGGSLNFVAVAEAIGFSDNSQLAAALAIDNVLGVTFIMGMNLVAGWHVLQRRYPWRSETLSQGNYSQRNDSQGNDSQGNDSPSGAAEQRFTLTGILVALATAASLVALGQGLADWLGLGRYALLFITVGTTVVATVASRYTGRLRGEDVLAMTFMYLFFAIIGAGADIGQLVNAAPGYFVLVAMMFLANLLFLLVAGKLFKLNYAELIVASLACIAGPPVAAAIAILMQWRNLVMPGILTGILGYIVGNFVGLGVFQLLGGALQ